MINPDNPPTLASRCEAIAKANVCTLEMLAGDGAGNAV